MYRINRAPFERVQAQLGLKAPVKVQWASERVLGTTAAGDQTSTGIGSPSAEHHIRLASVLATGVLGKRIAITTFLHELKHCQQRERLGKMSDVAYSMANASYGYHANPIELDARRFADENVDAYADLFI